MYSYNNSFIDKHIINTKTDYKNTQNTASSQTFNGQETSVNMTEMPSVTPDYNVSVPTEYTKTGVEKLSNGQEIHCYKLKNGQKVYIAPKKGAKTVLNTYVNTGALNEKDDERGISHFCEHMAFNGTKGSNGYMKLGKGDVFGKVSEMGGYTNASTNFAETNYTISIPQFDKSDFETIVKMQSAMMNNLEMSDEMTEKEHGPVSSEINMYSDMADTSAMNMAIKNLYNINTTSPDLVAGTVDNILNITSEKVTNYYKNNYYPANMSTVVTGNINPDEAIEIIAKNFKGENPKKTNRLLEPLNLINKPVRTDIISPKAIGTTGVLCFSGPANNDTKGNIEILALNHLLFNKKHSKTTEALEPYHVEVTASSDKFRTEPTDSTLLSLTYTTTESNSEPALKSIYDVISNFTPPSEEEMEVLKTGLKLKFEKRLDDTEDLNYLIGQTSLNGGISGCVDTVKIIDNLKSEDLVNALHKYYDLNRVSIALVHPETVKPEEIATNHKKAKNISFTGLQNKTADKRTPMNLDEVETLTLNNNCKVALTNTNNDITVFSANITDNIPANTKPGVQELLEQILVKGTNETVRLVDKNNITAFSGANGKNMYYEAELPAKNTAIAMRIMKNSLLYPDFSRETFEKAKKDLKTELLTEQPNAFDNAKSEIFPNSPRGYRREDILNNIDNIKLEEVAGLHKYLIDNGTLTFSASLPMSKYPEIKNVVVHELEEMPEFKKNEKRIFNDFAPVKQSKVIKDVANTAQADIIQAYKFPMQHDPKSKATYFIMNHILGKGDDTGLFNNLREKEKLAYSVSSDLIISAYKSGLLYCNILTTTDSDDLKSYDNVERSIKGFHEQINKMVNGEFTDKEFESAKLAYKRQLLESSDGQINSVLRMSECLNSVNGLDNVNGQYTAIDSITKEDIQKVAKEVFSNKPIYSVRASENTLEANKEFFDTLIK